jgi:hypothetical protein
MWGVAWLSWQCTGTWGYSATTIPLDFTRQTARSVGLFHLPHQTPAISSWRGWQLQKHRHYVCSAWCNCLGSNRRFVSTDRHTRILDSSHRCLNGIKLNLICFSNLAYQWCLFRVIGYTERTCVHEWCHPTRCGWVGSTVWTITVNGAAASGNFGYGQETIFFTSFNDRILFLWCAEVHLHIIKVAAALHQ